MLAGSWLHKLRSLRSNICNCQIIWFLTVMEGEQKHSVPSQYWSIPPERKREREREVTQEFLRSHPWATERFETGPCVYLNFAMQGAKAQLHSVLCSRRYQSRRWAGLVRFVFSFAWVPPNPLLKVIGNCCGHSGYMEIKFCFRQVPTFLLSEWDWG